MNMKLSNIKVIEKKVKNNDNGISYLFTEMRRLNSKIDNVARETRETRERLERLEHNQKIELNNKN
jgi:predicted RNase H-like nuclease (RuvC/YqgF family)